MDIPAPPPSPRFAHLDQLKWQYVRQIQIGDRVASAREKWFDFGPNYLSMIAEWCPGMMIHKHGHNSHNIVYVLAGSMSCGDRECPAGTHIALDKGDTFGPFIAGPEGVVLFEVMMGDPRSFAADPEGWQKLLAEKGAKQLPNPPIEMPSWLPDTRSPAKS